MDGAGIHTVDSKVTAVKNFPTQKSIDDVTGFLSLSGYYRSFIWDYASIASPVTLLKNGPYLSMGSGLGA